MDVIKELRGAYIELVRGLGYTIYDRNLPTDLPNEIYIIILEQTDVKTTSKCSTGHRTSIYLDITYRTDNNGTGAVCDDVADVIIPQIEQENFILPAALTMVKKSTRKLDDRTSDSFGDVYRVYHRLLRFEHLIRES